MTTSNPTDLYFIYHPKDLSSIESIEAIFNEAGLTASGGAECYSSDGKYDREKFLSEHDALVGAVAVVVFIGANEFELSQTKMIEAAFSTEAQKENRIFVCLVGKERTIDDVPADLRTSVLHYYPRRNTLNGAEPGVTSIAGSVISLRRDTVEEPPATDKVEGNAKINNVPMRKSATERRLFEFKKKASRDSVAIVLGTNWNESTGAGPDQSALKLLKELYNDTQLNVDTGAIMSLERAAYCYSIMVDNQELTEELGMPRSTKAFDSLANLTKTYTLKEENRQRKKKRSFVFFDTNVDACLERELIKDLVPFVSYVPLGDGDYIQTSIDRIERSEDGAYLIFGKANSFIDDESDEDITINTDDYEVDMESEIFHMRKVALSTPDGKCLLTDGEILMDICIDFAMNDFHESVGLRYKRTSREADLVKMDKVVAGIRMEALESFKPVIVKPFGCSQVSDSIVYSLDKIIRLGTTEEWIPASFESAMGQAHLAFIGFNAIDQNFVYLYNKLFLPIFLENRSLSKSDWLRLFVASKPVPSGSNANTLNEMITERLDQDIPSAVNFDNIRFITTDSLPDVINKLSFTE